MDARFGLGLIHLLRSVLTVGLVIGAVSAAGAQATSTFNGRILDQADAVLPGVTVTATNQATGVTRTTVTNEEGVYYLPGLEPGVYDVTTDLAGFAPAARRGVNLGVNATLTLDLKLALAGVTEAVTVTGSVPLIEVTQSKVASSIEATEIQNLPMITRTVSGMLALLPVPRRWHRSTAARRTSAACRSVVRRERTSFRSWMAPTIATTDTEGRS